MTITLELLPWEVLLGKFFGHAENDRQVVAGRYHREADILELHDDGRAFLQVGDDPLSLVNNGAFNIVGGYIEIRFRGVSGGQSSLKRFKQEGSSLVGVENMLRFEKVGPIITTESLAGETFQKRTQAVKMLRRWQTAIVNRGFVPTVLTDLGASIPLNDPWGHPYVLENTSVSSASHGRFQLRCLGPDGIQSEDDITIAGSL